MLSFWEGCGWWVEKGKEGGLGQQLNQRKLIAPSLLSVPNHILLLISTSSKGTRLFFIQKLFVFFTSHVNSRLVYPRRALSSELNAHDDPLFPRLLPSSPRLVLAIWNRSWILSVSGWGPNR